MGFWQWFESIEQYLIESSTGQLEQWRGEDSYLDNNDTRLCEPYGECTCYGQFTADGTDGHLQCESCLYIDEYDGNGIRFYERRSRKCELHVGFRQWLESIDGEYAGCPYGQLEYLRSKDCHL